jgi:ribosomal protein S18 acetylase RimI-like enzyme
MNLSLRPERPEDDEFLIALYAETRAAELAVTGWSESQKQAFLTSQFQLQRTHYRRYYAGAQFDVIQDQGRTVGRLYVHRGAEEIRVMDIALIPEYRNRGLGGELMQRLIAEAAATSRRISLHVEEENPAHRLYTRLGFREVERNGPYALMEWRPDSVAASRAHAADCDSGDTGC